MPKAEYRFYDDGVIKHVSKICEQSKVGFTASRSINKDAMVLKIFSGEHSALAFFSRHENARRNAMEILSGRINGCIKSVMDMKNG